MTLFPSTISYLRAAGSYVDGIWTDSAAQPLSFIGSCQPLSGKDMMSVEVGRKDVGKIKVYASTALEVSREDGDNAGDKIIWQGGYWEVIAEMANQNNLIPHFKYIAEYRGRVE